MDTNLHSTVTPGSPAYLDRVRNAMAELADLRESLESFRISGVIPLSAHMVYAVSRRNVARRYHFESAEAIEAVAAVMPTLRKLHAWSSANGESAFPLTGDGSQTPSRRR